MPKRIGRPGGPDHSSDPKPSFERFPRNGQKPNKRGSSAGEKKCSLAHVPEHLPERFACPSIPGLPGAWQVEKEKSRRPVNRRAPRSDPKQPTAPNQGRAPGLVVEVKHHLSVVGDVFRREADPENEKPYAHDREKNCQVKASHQEKETPHKAMCGT